MYIDLHLKIGLPFKVTLTNYTTKIESARHNIHFMKNAQSNKVFAAYSKIKAEATRKPVAEINAQLLKYYQTNFNQFNEIYADKIYNVDLKAAYATILFNDGYISRPTFDYILSIPKMDRLAAVGMLAGRKHIFEFDQSGAPVSCQEIISPTSNYFFYAVQRTYEIIDECKMLLEEDFLFSWVDGIYFNNKDNGPRLQSMLEEKFTLRSTFDELTEFEIKEKKDCYVVSYLKGEDKKVFNVPMPSQAEKQLLYSYLLTKNYKQ